MNLLHDYVSSDAGPLAFLAGGGEMGSLIRAMDWSKTSLGPVAGWPQSLRTTVSICLASDLPICVIWGPGLVQLYNDAYRVICGGKHPESMGQNFSEWSRIEIISTRIRLIQQRRRHAAATKLGAAMCASERTRALCPS